MWECSEKKRRIFSIPITSENLFYWQSIDMELNFRRLWYFRHMTPAIVKWTKVRILSICRFSSFTWSPRDPLDRFDLSMIIRAKNVICSLRQNVSQTHATFLLWKNYCSSRCKNETFQGRTLSFPNIFRIFIITFEC